MAITIPVYGSVIEWSNDGATWAAIPKPRQVIIPEVSREYRDVTNLDSPNGFREFQKGLKDGGEFTLECYYTKEGYAAAAAKEALTTAPYSSGRSFRLSTEGSKAELSSILASPYT